MSMNFGEAVAAYKLFRPSYPASLFSYLLEQVKPPHQTAVDLGAGTGLCAQELAQFFDSGIAVEPDPRMGAKVSALSTKMAR